MLKAGASGYLVKDTALKELINAVRTVSAGQTYLSQTVMTLVVKEYIRRSASDSSTYSLLSARQREILRLIAEGKATNKIASFLNVSVKTIKAHRRQIMDKLNLKSIA